MSRHDVAVTLPWLRAGTTALLAAADALTDQQLTEPSLLPDWTRAHVLAHVARNADALGRLCRWARTGVVTPMYESAQQRNDEIIATCAKSPAELRTDLQKSADRLERALNKLGPQQWAAAVRTAQGRTVPAAEVPWLRVREVWLHGVDLASRVRLEDLPDDLVHLLLDDVTAMLTTRDGCPSLVLSADDRSSWSLGGGRRGDGDSDSPATVCGPAASLLGWVTGRTTGDGLTGLRPPLPRWL